METDRDAERSRSGSRATWYPRAASKALSMFGGGVEAKVALRG
jgi:hypothetical protein